MLARSLFSLASAALVAAAFLATPVGAQTLPATSTATLVDPNSHNYVGTFVQDCKGSKARALVYLAKPYLIDGAQALGIDPEGTSTLDISLAAGHESIAVSAFGGAAKDGCLPIGSKLVLVLSPGLETGGLLVVVGQGFVTAVQQ